MLGTATAIMTAIWLCPSTAAIDSARSKPGTASMTSVTRMITESTQPPNAPASKPNNAPMEAPIASDTMPMTSDARAP